MYWDSRLHGELLFNLTAFNADFFVQEDMKEIKIEPQSCPYNQ